MILGDPKVLLLDEPSTGMDPEARRHMWNIIEQVSAERTVVLVSHSMEEVEALCTRVGVMVSGRLQCLGSIQHLKGKFGGDYQIEVRCHVEKAQMCIEHLQQHLTFNEDTTSTSDQIPSSVATPQLSIDEQHGGYFRLKVSRGLDLANTFRVLEAVKVEMQIYDYNVSQSSLEQVFIKFAKDQEEEPATAGQRQFLASDQPEYERLPTDHTARELVLPNPPAGNEPENQMVNVVTDSHTETI